MSLKVMMVGGRRCGKTSALASMFDTIINGPIKDFFTVTDQTYYEVKGSESQDKLNQKTLELRNKLEKSTTKTFLVDQGPTNHVWKYVLDLKLPGTNKSMQMEFMDVPGEFFVTGGLHAEETKQMISESNVFVIAIDTPYLMAPVEVAGDDEEDVCTDSISDAVNCVKDLVNFMTHINKNSNDSAMVIFTPIKCEKWVKEGRIDEVTERVMKVYDVAITALKAHTKMSICVMPVETAGNIVFSEMKAAYTAVCGGRKRRCCRLSEKMIRFENGDNYIVKEGDCINPDGEAVVISGTSLVRPYSWYKVNRVADMTNGLYSPHNCEQLPLHILWFWLNKIKAGKTGGLWERFWDFVLGSISLSDLQGKLSQIRAAGLMKDGCEGITYITRAY